MDSGAWRAVVHEVTKSWTCLSNFHSLKLINHVVIVSGRQQKDSVIQMLASGLPWWLSGKESTCQVEDLGLIPGLGRCPGGGNGHPLQYSCLRNPMVEPSTL